MPTVLQKINAARNWQLRELTHPKLTQIFASKVSIQEINSILITSSNSRTSARFLKLNSRGLDCYKRILDWTVGFPLLKFHAMNINVFLQGSTFDTHLTNPCHHRKDSKPTCSLKSSGLMFENATSFKNFRLQKSI